MKKLNNCFIICKNPDEKIKVLLILLINHTWNSGSKCVIPPTTTIHSFNSQLSLKIFHGRIVQSNIKKYEKIIEPYDIINETEKYLNELK